MGRKQIVLWELRTARQAAVNAAADPAAVVAVIAVAAGMHGGMTDMVRDATDDTNDVMMTRKSWCWNCLLPFAAGPPRD